MFCKYCGRPIDGNSVYCSDCGKQLNSEAVKTKDSSDSPVESSVKPKFSLLELSLVKLLGFTLILSAAAVIGAPLLSGISLSNAMQPPFLLIPIVFIIGLGVVIFNSYNLALSIGLTFFCLIIYFMPSPLFGGFFWFAKLMVAIYPKNYERLVALTSYFGSLLAIVTCCYLTTVGILSQKDFYAHSKKRGIISLSILLGFFFLFTSLPFVRKVGAGPVSNSGIGGLSPGDIFLSSYTGSDWLTNVIHTSYDSGSNRWAYEFKVENKREDGKNTIVDKIISNRGEVPLDEENVTVQNAVLKDNQIIIPTNIPVVFTVYSPEPFYSIRIHTDKLDADFLFIN